MESWLIIYHSTKFSEIIDLKLSIYFYIRIVVPCRMDALA